MRCNWVKRTGEINDLVKRFSKSLILECEPIPGNNINLELSRPCIPRNLKGAAPPPAEILS